MPTVTHSFQQYRHPHEGVSEEETTKSLPQMKRGLERDDHVESPSDFSQVTKKLKVDMAEAAASSSSLNGAVSRKKITSPSSSSVPSSSSSNTSKDEAEIDVNTHMVISDSINETSRVDPTELASAFALASLAGMSQGSQREGSDPAAGQDQESREVKEKVSKDETDDGVRKAASWDEARSPKADQHPISPEQRSPESMTTHHETPTNGESLMDDRSVSSASRKVHFAPNTKETTASPSAGTAMKARVATSRRLVVPSHHRLVPPSPSSHPNAGTNPEMTVSPRPHRMFGPGSPMSPFARTMPHLIPQSHYLRGTPPHHSPYLHPYPPHHSPHHHRLPPGAFHPAQQHHQPPLHFGGPHPNSVHSWSFPPPPNGPRPIGYPHNVPRQLLQPALLHHPGSGPVRPMMGVHVPHHIAAVAAMQREHHQKVAGAAAAAAAAAAVAAQNQWICDYCNVASFGTYEEACIHEETCKARHLPKHRQSSSDDADSPDRSLVPASRSLISMSRSRSDASAGDDDNMSMTGDHHYPRFFKHGGVPSASSSHEQQQWHQGVMSLAIEESDQEWLSELNCFVRSHCVEAFSATEDDVNRSSKRGRITLHQVGIRCCFCSHLSSSTTSNNSSNKESIESDNETDGETMDVPTKSIAAVSFPTSISGIYESVKRWQRVHLEVCEHVPAAVREQLDALSNTNVWVPTTRQYWADAARALGLVDTDEGIRFSLDPTSIKDEVKHLMTKVSSGDEQAQIYHPTNYRLTVPQRPSSSGEIVVPMGPPSRLTHLHHAAFGLSGDGRPGPSSSNPTDKAVKQQAGTSQQLQQQQQHVESLSGYIVFPHDMEMIPPYVYFLMRQVEPCLFTEADRFVARSKGPVGYPGFQCRHCNGHAGLGKYFPVSSKSLSTNSTSQNIHAHLLKCRKCPDAVKDRLLQLKVEKSRAPRLEPGWRKVFFDKVWARLHRDAEQQQTTTEEADSDL